MGAVAKLIQVKNISDERGILSVVEDELGFVVKRFFYIYDVPSNGVRGGHGHLKTKMAMISLNGYCHVEIVTRDKRVSFHLERPDQCLLVEPGDWHQMYKFEKGSTLLVLASEKFDKSDYFYEEPK